MAAWEKWWGMWRYLKTAKAKGVRFELKAVSAVFEFFRRSLRENEYNPIGWGTKPQNFDFQILPPLLNISLLHFSKACTVRICISCAKFWCNSFDQTEVILFLGFDWKEKSSNTSEKKKPFQVYLYLNCYITV